MNNYFRRRFLFHCAAFLAMLCAAAPGLPALAGGGDSATTLILVRHAEKDTLRFDPPLSAAGRERSRRLGRMLRDCGARALFSTQYARTQQTLEPISGIIHVPCETVFAAPDSLGRHVDDLLAKILGDRAGGVVVVSSHSNVIPLILKRLGVVPEISIADDEYDNLFVVTIRGPGPAALLRLRY